MSLFQNFTDICKQIVDADTKSEKMVLKISYTHKSSLIAYENNGAPRETVNITEWLLLSDCENIYISQKKNMVNKEFDEHSLLSLNKISNPKEMIVDLERNFHSKLQPVIESLIKKNIYYHTSILQYTNHSGHHKIIKFTILLDSFNTSFGFKPIEPLYHCEHVCKQCVELGRPCKITYEKINDQNCILVKGLSMNITGKDVLRIFENANRISFLEPKDHHTSKTCYIYF